MRRTLTATLALVVALTGVPALAGCSVVEGIIEQQTGGDIDLGGTSVPADFPSEVPLIDGDIVNGSGFSTNDGKVWNIIVKVADAAAFDTIKTQLEGAGFAFNETGTESGEVGTGLFDGANYGVLVLVADAGEQGWVANYTVSEKSAGE